MRDSQRKGDYAKTLAISYFTSQGYDVGILITESAPYDLLVDTPEGVKRVQVKYSTRRHVDLRRVHSNSTGYVVRRYSKGAFDWLFVFNPDLGTFLKKDYDFSLDSFTLKDEYRV